MSQPVIHAIKADWLEPGVIIILPPIKIDWRKVHWREGQISLEVVYEALDPRMVAVLTGVK